jgi:galactose mutarotase-like enzyme
VSARLIRGWSLDGFEAWILENRRLRVTVLPELGGKVHELIDKAADRDLLWHNPRTPPRKAPFGAHFDDWWSGGWDEIFPTGDIARLHDEPLPYMGELWSVPWSAAEVDAGSTAASLVTTGLGTIAPARLERTLELRDDEPVLRVRYRLTNLDVRPLPFLWGVHPALAVTAAHRMDLPAGRMLVGVSSGPKMGQVGATYDWPQQAESPGPGRRDASHVLPADATAFGGHWATELREGWWAVTDTGSRRGLALSFPRDVFPYLWLWQVYGGWRGHHHLCLEPWSGYPMQLEQAMEAGRQRELAPGASLEAELAFVLFSGLERVTSVSRHGDGFRVS